MERSYYWWIRWTIWCFCASRLFARCCTYGAGIGAITGVANSAIWGTNIGQGALLGGVTGGILGGVGGYISGKKLGVNLWTGSGEGSFAMKVDGSVGGGRQWKTTEEMILDYNSTISARDQLMKAGGVAYPDSMSWRNFGKIIPTWLK